MTINASPRTKAINITGNAKANKILGGSGNDTLAGSTGNDTLTGGDGADIFIYSSGKDVITDFSAQDTLKISGGSVSAYSISGNDATFKIGSGTVNVKGGKNTAITVVDSKKTMTYDGGLIYDGTVAKAKAMTVSAAYGNTLAAYGASVVTIDSSARTKALNITGNAANNKIIGTSGNDTINGGAGNDTLTGGKGNDIFIYEAGNDVITDYANGQNTIKIASGEISSYSFSGNDAVLKIGKGSVKVTGGKNLALSIVDAGGNFRTYQGGLIYDGTVAKAKSVTVTSAYGNTLAAYGASVETIDAAARTSAINITGNAANNFISGGAGKDVIDGGKGNDSIQGGKGNDTLTGGAGKDIFIYSTGDGNDVITDYVAGEDKIKIVSGSVTGYSVKNSDAILKIGSGAITLKNAGTSAISVLDKDDNIFVYYNGLIYNNTKISKATAVTITSDYEGEFGRYGASVETIDAAARTKAIEITGNTGANYILGGKGKDTIDAGKGDDIIIGGKGNDILTGGKGDDIFYFGGADGNDTITDYSAGDIISVGGAVTYSTKNSDAILKIGTGNVTLQNAADMAITIVGAEKIASIYSGKNVTTETYIGKVTIPSDALQYNGHSYYIFDSGATWDEAKAYAEELGGHLVAITDANEQNAIKNLLAAHSNAKNSYWLGGYRDDKLGWQWLTGENWSYTGWGYGQPDGDFKNGALCDALMMYYSSANGWHLGDWNDFFRDGVNGQTFFGTENFGYIVEWDTIISSATGTDTVYVTLPAETITVGGDTVTVEVTLPPETITVGGDTVTVEVTLPPETVTVSETVTVYSGEGGGSVINGTSGADILYGTAGNDTISLGAGNDIYVYSGGNDYDVITDYKEGADRISLDGATFDGGLVVGNDVLLAIGGGILKLENAKYSKVTLVSGGIETEYVNAVKSGTGADGVTVTLEADRVDAFSLSAYNSTVDRKAGNIDGSPVKNSIWIYGDDENNIILAGKAGGGIWAGKGNDIIHGGAGDDTIYYWSDGGNDTIYNYKTGDQIRMRRVDEDDTTTFDNFEVIGNDVIINFTSGNTITLKDAGDQTINLSEWNYAKNYYDWTYYSYGSARSYYNSTFGYVTISGGTATLNKKYSSYFRTTMYSDNPATVDASAVTTLMTIYGDDRANLIKASKGGSYIWAGKGDDTIYGGAGNDTIFYWSNGGNDTIYDYKTGDQIRLRRLDEDDTTTFKNFTVSGNDVIINFTSGNTITLKDAGDQTINLSEWNYAGNYYDWTYYGYGSARSYYNSTFGYVTISGGTATLNKKYSSYFRTTMYSDNPATVDASAVTTLITIYGDDRANLIKASNGGSGIWAGKGNDTIYGGAGNDTLFYWSNDGNKTIYDYKTGDQIRLRRLNEDDTTTFKNFTVTDNDVVINFTNGSKITLKDAGEQTINLSEWNYAGNYYDWTYYGYGSARSYYNSTFGYVTISGGTATLNKKYQGNCATNYYANVTNLDASNVTVSTNLYGDSKANVIHAGKAGGSINGGGGNDTIYCGAGTDYILYYSGGGSDTVCNIGAGDYVSLNGCTAERISVSGTDVIIKIEDSSNRITLKDATGKRIWISGQNWQTYTASSSNAISGSSSNFASDLFDDDNFDTVNELDSIIDSGGEITNLNFSATNFENLAPEISYSGDK